MKSKIKKLVGKVHLWLGLLTGLVVLIVGLTGCIYAFQQEIQDLTQSYRFVEVENKPFVPPSLLQKTAEKQLPGMSAKRVYFNGNGRAASVLFYDKTYYHTVYLNPYNGEVLKVKNMRSSFFSIVLSLHRTLLLPYGKYIVAYSTLIFLVMLISGIVLWWPKSKKNTPQRLTIKWNARWRRVNYDLHNVLGFYMTWIALFIAITGLVFSFNWVRQSVYWVSSGGKAMPERGKAVSDTLLFTNHTTPSVDKLWLKLKDSYSSQPVTFMLPQKKEDALGLFSTPTYGQYYQADYRYFDQYSLKELDPKGTRGRYKDASVADKVMLMNYDVHTGGIFGFAGKLLAFFASLVAASLPVTGFMIYLERYKKRKKASSGSAKASAVKQKARVFDLETA